MILRLTQNFSCFFSLIMTSQEGRRQDVMERFRELLSQIATHEKQLESAKKTGEESVKKKDAQMKRVLRRTEAQRDAQ